MVDKQIINNYKTDLEKFNVDLEIISSDELAFFKNKKKR